MKSKLIIFSLIIIFPCLFASHLVKADTLIYSQNFDNLNLGTLNGQDGWATFYQAAGSPNNYFQIENTIVAKGTQAVSYASSTYQNRVVTFSAQDNESGVGVLKTEYSLDNGNTWQEYTDPFTISEDGIHIILYRSQDFVGNTEQFKSQEIKIDKTSPRLQLTANPGILWPPNRKLVNVTIGGFASDSLSGIDSISFKVIDEYGKIQPTISNFGNVIQLEAWRNGDDLNGRLYTFSATATDKAGNQTTTSTTVICPHDQRE
jgi:hypothetical protein